jgi:hypothetical protein
MLTVVSAVPYTLTTVPIFISLNLINRIYRHFTPSLPAGNFFKAMKMLVQQQRLMQPDIEQERVYRSN